MGTKLKQVVVGALAVALVISVWVFQSSKKGEQDSLSPLGHETEGLAEKLDQDKADSVPDGSGDTVAIAKKGEKTGAADASKQGSKADLSVDAESKIAPKIGVDSSEELKTTVQKEEKQNNCFTITFQHRKMASHADGEACMHHRNLLTLKHKNFDQSSLCVRVNGTPVNYQRVKGRSDQVIIGPIAGPQSEVTARYCLKKSPECRKDCKVPKDEFMAAIGGMDSDSGSPEIAVWDPNDPNSAKDVDVTKQIGQDLQRALAESSDLSLFKDWERKKEDVSCKI